MKKIIVSVALMFLLTSPYALSMEHESSKMGGASIYQIQLVTQKL